MASQAETPPPVVLYGYAASPLTTKIRLCLRLKQIPYTFVAVPSKMPRPLLHETFNLGYRKIPVLTIARDLYCDSFLIADALEHFFPAGEGYGSLYPGVGGGRRYRGLVRLWGALVVDRGLFRVMTGLMPDGVWGSGFGRDREGLIGHRIQAEKLEGKRNEMLGRLDGWLGMLEDLLGEKEEAGVGGGEREGGPWLLQTRAPGLVDVGVFHQVLWGRDLAAGRLTMSLTGGEVEDVVGEGMDGVFNARRYPRLFAWFRMCERYFEGLPVVEETVDEFEKVIEMMKQGPGIGAKSMLLPTPAAAKKDLDAKYGLKEGALVSIAPDDTGRDNPTVGKILAWSPEEIVIKPETLDPPAKVDVRIHFPRLGFAAKPVKDVEKNEQIEKKEVERREEPEKAKL